MGPGQDGNHADSSGPLSRPDRIAWAAMVIALFVVYNANFRENGSLDAAGATLMPASILGEATFNLDEFRGLIAAVAQPPWFWKGLFVLGSMQERNGHLLSSYPVGGAILATPVYALPFALGWLNDYHAFRVAGKISASLMVALSAGFLFGTLRRQLSRRAAVTLALGYGLGTTAWSVASQGMWQHGPGMLCLSAALFFLVRLEENDRAVDAALAGAALGFAVVCRTTNLFAAAALALFVLVRHRRRLLPFAVPAALLVGWLVWYNLTTYGDPAGGYRAITSSIYASKAWPGFDSNLFTTPLGYGLASILLAPSKGLLIYSPHLVFGLVGAAVFWRRKGGPLTPYLALWVVLSLVWLAKFRTWWGGTAYGPRYLSEATLPLVALTASLWPVIRARRALFAALATTLLLSVGIHFVGAFFAPCGWHTTPVWADYFPERHWDWRDPEILRCLSQGLKQGPLPFELLHPGT